MPFAFFAPQKIQSVHCSNFPQFPFPTSEQDLTVLVSAACVVLACLIPRPEECLEMSTKAPNPVDKYVGSRVRMRRIMLGMSQEKLGEALGLTFQQIQKYEKGTNRVGASRIQQISEILQVPVSFLFEGGPSGAVNGDSFGEGASPAYISDFLATPEGLPSTLAFTPLSHAKLRPTSITML